MENCTPNRLESNPIAESRKQRLRQYLEDQGVYDESFETIINFLFEKTDYFYGPSSTKWHAAYPGGGFDHAFNVTKCLVGLTERLGLVWHGRNSPYIIGLLHDATKINSYVMRQEMNPLKREIETWYEWDPDSRRLSDVHGEDSLLKVLEYMTLTEEEKACIRWHMGAYEGKNSWPEYDAAIRKFPNVLWTHTADMYASKLMEECYAE